MSRHDVVIVGSGVIGLAAAWRLSARGHKVALVDPNPARGASYAAAGMIAPVTEATYEEEELVKLAVRSARAWPAFARELEDTSGEEVGLSTSGTLLVAKGPSDRLALQELLEFHHHLGLTARWCAPTACRELEPLLAPSIAGAIEAPDDQQVDNRRLLRALLVAAERAGVTTVNARATTVIHHGQRVAGVACEDRELSADNVIVAAGYQTCDLAGLPDDALVALRPVKGQILRFSSPDRHLLPTRVIRGLVAGRSTYIVARADGSVVIGATVEERGEDTTTTAGGVFELLDDAIRVLPAVREYVFEEAMAALRPSTPDNAPVIGTTSVAGLHVSTGHYRHGILLCPVSTEAVVALVENGKVPPYVRPLALDRPGVARSKAELVAHHARP